MSKSPAKQNAVTSKQINDYIKKHSKAYESWVPFVDSLRANFGVSLSIDAVRKRASSIGAGLKPKTFAPDPTSPASPSVALKNELRARLKAQRKAVHTVETLADALDVAPSRVRAAMNELKNEGLNIALVANTVELSRDVPKAAPLSIDARARGGTSHKFGVTADNHLGSKYARLEVLEALYDNWAEQGIKAVYQLGNMIDGEARFNKFDLLVHGIEGQAAYFAKHWPKRDGITTYFITGDDHEGWYTQREGVEIGKYLEGVARNSGRTDLVYLGHMEHDIVFVGNKQNTVMRLIHAGGGSAYATSYAAQKIVESYTGGEKPDVLLIGHYHKAEYGFPRGVHCVQAGTTMDQSPFMRKNKLQAHVGGWTIDMTINEAGAISRFRQEWMPFYDRPHYRGQWKYGALAGQAA